MVDGFTVRLGDLLLTTEVLVSDRPAPDADGAATHDQGVGGRDF
jgi:hypothetical protein